MSSTYIQRLRTILDEFDLARESLVYVAKNLGRQDVADHFKDRLQKELLSPKRFERAAEKLDTTFFVRLTAEFEGILKDHLRTNHPSIKQSGWKVDWLISNVRQAENITLDPRLLQLLNEVRDYRNAIAHGGQHAAPVPFKEALKRYNKFLSKLPDPFR